MYVLAGLHTQFSSQLTPRLQLILKGIQRNQATSHPPRVCLPITLQIMRSTYDLLTNQPHSYTSILIWAACSLAFFSFLRVSEFTIPSDASYDDECHLSLADVSVDNRNNLQLLRVKIKQSKTDSFRRGVDIYLGATGRTLCPIKAILPYLALRPKHCNGPLFILEDGCDLTRQCSAAFCKIYYQD